MTDQEFVSGLNHSVIEENMTLYESIFKDTDRNSVTDDYWKLALSLFDNLDIQDKNKLFLVIKQIQIDTVSNILGVIDGTSFLSDEGDDFQLTSEGIDISGNLQDLFLESHE